MKYYRLNYEISSWLPKGSVWVRDDNGFWSGTSKNHTVGNAGNNDAYWFAHLLEQESIESSAHNDSGEIDILTEVEPRLWIEVEKE